MNQYEPWIELGMDEVAYFKMRYIEAQKDLALCKEALEKIAGCVCHCRDEEIAREALAKLEGER